MSLSSFLPKPSLTTYDPDVQARYRQAQAAKTGTVSTTGPPPYGARKGWIPRTQADFGDGGAFPEVIVAQYPLGMGAKKKSASSNALALQYDADGTVKYDAIASQGHRDDKIIHTGIENTLHAQFDESDLQRPDEDAIESTTEATRLALEKLVNHKISSALPVRKAEKQAPAQYIRFTPAQQGGAFNSGAKQRIIRMVEMQKDPMEPPKFNTTKKIPRGPPSPPVPVLHSPTRKLTAKEQQDWKIPPCVSNWKNAKGYTIPLDKRLAADGRGLQSVTINENFARLAEALFIADRKAREAVEMRAQVEKKMASKEKEKQESKLRALAAKARMERAGISTGEEGGMDTESASAVGERNEIREERHRERARERNIARAAPDKQAALNRDSDRDISEKIALGLPSKKQNDDSMFDSRLFNKSAGIGSGFAADDDTYDVYSDPLKKDSNLARHMYRPSKNIDQDVYGDDLEKIVSTKRFVPDKDFQGSAAQQGSSRDGPVQFEKAGERHEEPAAADEDDPFGLEQFLIKAKEGGRKRGGRDDDKSGSSSSKRKR